MRNSVTPENLLDLAAFIKKSAETGHMSVEEILVHVEHDVRGFLTKGDDEHWLPRTVGWNNLVKKGLIK